MNGDVSTHINAHTLAHIVLLENALESIRVADPLE
jgi:hypothetical protein